MSRVVKKPVTWFGVVAILVLAPFFLRSVTSTWAQQQPAPVAASVLQVALLRAGLSAEALAAVGCSSQQVTAVVANARTELAAHPTRIPEGDTAYATARVSADALARKIQSGLASQEEITSYATASTALGAAESERQAAIDAVFNSATQGLSGNQIALLQRIQTNRTNKLPIEFLTVERTDDEWLNLRNALSNERITAKHGEEANAECQSLLSTLRANSTVAAAKASLVANLASLTTSWNTATTGG